MSREFRRNAAIRAREVRVIGDAGEQLGILSLPQALELARERNLDLVEVAPTSVPPVCRLLDYGRFKYEQAKKERQSRKGQRTSALREIRMRPKIDEHDIIFKLRNVRRFLEEGDKVKVSIIFRGREITHPELGKGLLDRVMEASKDVSTIERVPLMEGRNMVLLLAPLPGRPAKAIKPAEAPTETKETTPSQET